MVKSNDLEIVFVKTRSGREPVQKWMSQLRLMERKKIFSEIRKARNNYLLGLGINIKKIRGADDLWRIACRIPNRNVRIFFCIIENKMVILHVFFKRENQNYLVEIETAISRMKELIND